MGVLMAINLLAWFVNHLAGSRAGVGAVTSSSAVAPPRFYETGANGLLNLAATWDVNDHVSLLLAGENLTDRNYVLVDGFPEEGRNFAATLRLRN
jgi:iron complex outermembrane recepter protein